MTELDAKALEAAARAVRLKHEAEYEEDPSDWWCDQLARAAVSAYLDATGDGWRDIETAPKDGTAFLVWEVVVCDEEDEDGNVIARNQRHERAVIANWMWGSLAEPSGRMRPSNGRWDHWRPLPAPPALAAQEKK